MEKITEGQYLDAISLIRRYFVQIESEITTKENNFEYENVENHLSVRVLNCLRDYDAHDKLGWDDYKRWRKGEIGHHTDITISFLLSIKKKELMKIRNFGRTSLSEINNLLSNKGFGHKQI